MKLLLEIPRMFDSLLVYASDKTVKIEIESENRTTSYQRADFTLDVSELNTLIEALREAHSSILKNKAKEGQDVFA